jgi:hypothetical protein
MIKICRHNWETKEGKGYYRKGKREIIVATHVTMKRCIKCHKETYAIHEDNKYLKCFEIEDLYESRQQN